MVPIKKCVLKNEKRKKKVMNLEQKVHILELLKSGMKVSAVAKKYSVNESTIRSIRDSGYKIITSFKQLGSQAKYSKISRGSCVEEMEDLLLDWIKDNNINQVLTSALIREKALSIYNYLSERDGNSSSDHFNASKGWFDRFKRRLSFLSNEANDYTSNEPESCEFQSQLLQLIKDKDYQPAQIFHCDEVRLFWKRLPKNFLPKERSSPIYSTPEEYCTLILCANESGTFKCKPMMIYKNETPDEMKRKNENCLPVFWRCNKNANVTTRNFKEWFLDCFLPKVKEFLQKEKLELKGKLSLHYTT